MTAGQFIWAGVITDKTEMKRTDLCRVAVKLLPNGKAVARKVLIDCFYLLQKTRLARHNRGVYSLHVAY